jgi:hypothetical protein
MPVKITFIILSTKDLIITIFPMYYMAGNNNFILPQFHAHGEQQAAKTLAEAAEIMQSQPVLLRLRYLQTLVEMVGEKNSTIIPLTVDIVNALSHIKTKENGK